MSEFTITFKRNVDNKEYRLFASDKRNADLCLKMLSVRDVHDIKLRKGNEK